MFMHVQRMINEIVADEPDPAAANALQEGLGGQFGEMRTMMQYLFQAFNFRGAAGKPYKDLLYGVGTEEIGHVELIATTIARLTDGSPQYQGSATKPVDEPGKGGATPLASALGAGNIHHYLVGAQGALPVDAVGNPWSGSYVYNSGNLVLDLLYNLMLESTGRLQKCRIYEMTENKTARATVAYLIVRDQAHENAFAKALESLGHGGVWNVSLILVELAGHEPAVAGGHHCPQLIDQRRLTHPRRPTHYRRLTPALQRVLERLLKCHHLRLAAHQPRGRLQPDRKITLADTDRRRGRSGLHAPDRLQVIDQPVGALVAAVRFLLQQVQDDRRQRLRDRRIQLRRRPWHPGQMGMHQAQRVPGAERWRAGRQLVEGGTQRVQVGTMIHRPAGTPGLLRCQIGQRPHDLGVMAELRAHLRQRARQREIHHTRAAVAREHKISRLQNMPSNLHRLNIRFMAANDSDHQSRATGSLFEIAASSRDSVHTTC
jgi:Mn-containing catalase